MSTAIAKAVASFVSAGFCAFSACHALGLSMQVAAPSAAVGAFSGLIFFARVWIQGYYFDKRCSTAAELTGRTAIVTGGTVGGLGYAGAELLASMGATVVVTVRSCAKGEEAVAKLKRAAGHERVSYVVIDFLSKASVRAGAATLTAAHKRLDFLVLNAGVGSGPPADMWSSNMVLPFLLTQLLTPLLVQTAKEFGDIRVVSVSSGAHKKASINLASPYETESEGAFGGPYGQSKLAQIMHMRELQRRLREQPALAGEQTVRCISVTPGFALTNITAGKIPKPVMPLVWLLARSARMGAQVIKMACVDAVPGGCYLSNCYVKPTEGAGGCSNDPQQWSKLWALLEKCVEDERCP